MITGVHLTDPITWYLHAHGSEQAEFWVAVGTLALAAVTTWLVLKTGNVIVADDRRHRQSLAPIVEAKPRGGWDGFTLSNVGLGPAVDVIFHIKGAYQRPSADEKGMRIFVPTDFDETMKASVIPIGGSREYSFVGTSGFATTVNSRGIKLDVASLEYWDIFGNPYESVVADHEHWTYEWKRPQKLK